MPSTRQRWMLQPLSWRRGGAVALLVLTLLAAGVLMLDGGPGAELAGVAEQVATSGEAPLAAIETVAAGARLVLLSDVPGRASPKRLAAEVIRRLAGGAGLDAVLLAVPASEQPYIDAYLAGSTDAAALLARPGAVREAEGAARDFARIYEAVREVNQDLPLARRIRIVAGDVEGWPPPEGTAPVEVARRYAERSEQLLRQLDREVFSTMPDARVLIFVDGYLTLQGTHGELRFAGGESVRVEWLGELLRRRSGTDARTVLLDPGALPQAARRMPAYHGTLLHRALRRELDSATGLRTRGALGEVRAPVLELDDPGLTLEILPLGYRLGTAAQGYVFLPGG